MDSSKYLLVDVRPSANYRGWPEQFDSEGEEGKIPCGHLMGAINLGADWDFNESAENATECLK